MGEYGVSSQRPPIRAVVPVEGPKKLREPDLKRRASVLLG